LPIPSARDKVGSDYSTASATLSGEAQPSEDLTALVKKIRPGVERLEDLVTGDAMTMAVEANVTSLNKIYEAV
jgi:hypothetical protein